LSIAPKFLEELKSNEKLEDEVMAFIAERIALKPSLRQIVLSAILREVATKDDIENLRSEIANLKKYIDDGISSVEQRTARIEGQLSLFIKVFIAFNVPILIGIIGILLKMWIP